ncbi:hypothetical protein OJ996_09235 [Luteolibacter sp. GHJ8]|uniref:Uncharacterized protein n=1 Tax=Luteolibacter rhizosphaerae TaxID=2989719 RepID=A0ABT3G258_9BACT|nr:hypothetical protein [Luteolibacter rhizosphaerae]MCW1913757.1 hypothetical protein [Luteolibacter rhizosphaerae]
MDLRFNTSKCARTGILSLASLLGLVGQALASGPDIVNIINFIRGVEPRGPVDLVEPVERQLELGRKHRLPTTWLIQYDALIRPEFTELLKRKMGPNDEIGAWIEVVQPQVEAAGLKWRGRYPWDWHVNVGFTHGYEVEERKKLMDVYMAKFKEVFGKYPKSAGCWIIDAPTLNYLHDRYGVETACNCKDQSGTDGYTLWGGYWNQAYYPSRLNAFMPAQTAERQLNVPVFRMLGSDPVHQYDQGIGGSWQGVVTLEPVYRPGGGEERWVDWFFDTNFNQPSLAFSYMQAGQENSFGWRDMSAGLIDQYAKLAELKRRGKIRVETLQASGKWFRENFKTTPASAVVALNDSKGEGKRSVWYESRFYRVNLYWEGDQWRIRDLHVFNQDYPERYLEDCETTAVATYDTLPVMDGFHWSKPGDIAGIRGVVHSSGASQALTITGLPDVKEDGADSLVATCKLAAGGELQIRFDPTRLALKVTGDSAPADWGMELAWAESKSTSVAELSKHAIGYRHSDFAYSLSCGSSEVTRVTGENKILIKDDNGSVIFSFGPDKATSLRGDGKPGTSAQPVRALCEAAPPSTRAPGE